MKHLVVADHDKLRHVALSREIRQAGGSVLEIDEDRALFLLRDGMAALVVLSAADRSRAVRVLSDLAGARQATPVLVATLQANTSDVTSELLARVVMGGAAPAAASNPASEASGAAALGVVGESTNMRDLRAALRQLSTRPHVHVLIAGEAGTGKLTLARALHAATAPAGVFVVGRAARLRDIVSQGPASELATRGGTLYVPVDNDLRPVEQERLAGWLSERELEGEHPVRVVVGVRVVGRVAEREVRGALLHPELSSRLPTFLEVSPLRRRAGDIPSLVRHLLRPSRQRGSAPVLTDAALRRLQQLPWPGNVRELANVLEQAALAGRGVIDTGELPSVEGAAPVDYVLPSEGVDLAELERSVLTQALVRARGNQTRAATLLGLTRDQVRYRMGKFGLAAASAAEAE